MYLTLIEIQKRPLWKRILFINNYEATFQVNGITEKTSLFLSDGGLTQFLLLHYIKNRFLGLDQFSNKFRQQDWKELSSQVSPISYNIKELLNQTFWLDQLETIRKESERMNQREKYQILHELVEMRNQVAKLEQQLSLLKNWLDVEELETEANTLDHEKPIKDGKQ